MGRRPVTRRPPPAAPAEGGAKKTGWEALDKWVGSGDAAPAAGAPAEGGAKKTGWEALDKWVGVGRTPPPRPGRSGGRAGRVEPVVVGRPSWSRPGRAEASWAGSGALFGGE